MSKTFGETTMLVEGFFVLYSTRPSSCSVNARIDLATPSVDSKSGLSGKNSTIASLSLISSGSAPIRGIISAKSSDCKDSFSMRFKSSKSIFITGILNPQLVPL